MRTVYALIGLAAVAFRLARSMDERAAGRRDAARAAYYRRLGRDDPAALFRHLTRDVEFRVPPGAYP